MTTLPAIFTPDLLDLPASRLLSAFGAERATPGSGSAAALNGASACELIITNAKLTVKRAATVKRKEESRYVLAQIEGKRNALRQLVQDDTDVFASVVAARKARDRAKTKGARRSYAELARRKARQGDGSGGAHCA